MAEESPMVSGGTPFNKPSVKESDPSKTTLPRIRTYAADMSSAIRERGATLTSIVEAQQGAKDRAISKVPKNETLRTRLIVGGGVFLIFLGVGLVSLVSFLSQKQEDTATLFPDSIIFPNGTVVVELGETESLGSQLSYEREGKNLALGEVERIIITENDIPLSPQQVAEALGFPGAVVREVEEVMVGIHSFDRNQPFVIFKIIAYDRSFNGMLEWEKEAGRGLGEFFKPRNAEGQSPNLVFEDVIIRNIDVRKSQSAWPILYAYPARDIFILTTNEFTLREITSRLGGIQP